MAVVAMDDARESRWERVDGEWEAVDDEWEGRRGKEAWLRRVSEGSEGREGVVLVVHVVSARDDEVPNSLYSAAPLDSRYNDRWGKVGVSGVSMGHSVRWGKVG